SDMPFVRSETVSGLLQATPKSTDCAYPIFTREEFNAAFPGGRSSFAKLADGEWTGSSALVLDVAAVLRNTKLLKKAFAARKNLLELAGLLGPSLALRYASGQLRVADVQARIEALTGSRVTAVRGADPAL